MAGKDTETLHMPITTTVGIAWLIHQDDYIKLQSLYFTINGKTFEYPKDAQVWPRALNEQLKFPKGVPANTYVLTVGKTSTKTLAVNGLAWCEWSFSIFIYHTQGSLVERFYVVLDEEKQEVGVSKTDNTLKVTNSLPPSTPQALTHVGKPSYHPHASGSSAGPSTGAGSSGTAGAAGASEGNQASRASGGTRAGDITRTRMGPAGGTRSQAHGQQGETSDGSHRRARPLPTPNSSTADMEPGLKTSKK